MTGLLELCGAPDRNIFFNEVNAILDRRPNSNPEAVYYQSFLHGLARGVSRNALSQAGLCGNGDPAESAHYQTVAAKHFRQFVLPLASTP